MQETGPYGRGRHSGTAKPKLPAKSQGALLFIEHSLVCVP